MQVHVLTVAAFPAERAVHPGRGGVGSPPGYTLVPTEGRGMWVRDGLEEVPCRGRTPVH